MSSISCPQCQASNDDQQNFCGHCGARLNPDFDADRGFLASHGSEKVEQALDDQTRYQRVVEIETAHAVLTRLMKWAKLFSFFVGIPVVIVLFLAAFFGFKSYRGIEQHIAGLKQQLSDVLKQQATEAKDELSSLTKAYSKLTYADWLSSNSEYKGACEEYKEAFKALQNRGHDIPPDSIKNFLMAIVNTEKPDRFRNEVAGLVTAMENRETGSQLHELAWYYFRVRDFKQARDYFNRALRQREADDKKEDNAITYWSLALLALADDYGIEEAMTYYRKAAALNQSGFGAISIKERRSRDFYQNHPIFAWLRKSIAGFDKSLDEMLDKIDAENHTNTQ